MIWTHNLDPIIVSIGPLDLHWYGLMYALGFAVVYTFLVRMARVGRLALTPDQIDGLLFALFLGVILGGRLGYVFLYQLGGFMADPLAVLRVWEGGMSFHGAALGTAAALAIAWRVLHIRISFLALSDALLVPAALALVFGRFGNFINGELYGRLTDGSWGIVFPLAGDGLPRHPAQLYAMGKDLFLFGTLYALYQARQKAGMVTFSFFLGYGVLRTLVEGLWREPLDGFVGPLTLGQVYSLPMVLVGIVGLVWIYRK